MRNKEIKKIIGIQLLLLVIFIILNFIFNLCIHQIYKGSLIENNSYIVGSIIENHPELEEEIINNLIRYQNNPPKGIDILEKYGLTDIGNIEYLTNIQSMKKIINICSFIFLIVLILIINIIYVIFIRKQYKRIKDIHKYLNRILNNDYSFDIRDYDEGDISDLKNDIYKITILLKEQNELSLKDKKNLEILLSDISHQIKTPLTSMYVINDLLSQDNLDPKLRKQFLMKNNQQLKRIEWLVSTLLKISRLDSGMVTFKKEKVFVDKLIKDALEPLLIPIELKEQKVNIEGDSNFEIE
ncbi:MAG: HAMP domain-containing histidine kinase, partial [Mollicutes bacterium]|nr:HAMP domain-containing histidine kinase [Mollicutes bacterium]